MSDLLLRFLLSFLHESFRVICVHFVSVSNNIPNFKKSSYFPIVGYREKIKFFAISDHFFPEFRIKHPNFFFEFRIKQTKIFRIFLFIFCHETFGILGILTKFCPESVPNSTSQSKTCLELFYEFEKNISWALTFTR